MADARMILIRVGSRTKAVPLPPGTDMSQVEVRVEDSEDGLHEMAVVRPISEKTRAALQILAARKVASASVNLARAKERSLELLERDAADLEWFTSRLSQEQASLWGRLIKVLGFARSPSQGEGLRISAADWVRRVREMCPEPWGLDWIFVRLWLVSPLSMANLTGMNGEKHKQGKLMGIRRAVAMKKFHEAWAEQKGPITVPAGEESRMGPGSNHPFAILREALRTSRLASMAQFEKALGEYRDAGVISGAEHLEGRAALAKGDWFGVPVPFRVV